MESAIIHESLSTSEIMKDSVILDYIDEGVFVNLIFLYILYRMIKTSSLSIGKFLKGNLRTCAIFFILFSGVANVVYTCSLVFLSYFYDIDKSYVEKIGHLHGVHLVDVFGTKVDLVAVLNLALSTTQIFKISALFLLIGLWLPCAYNFAISVSEESYRSEKNHALFYYNGRDALLSQKNLAEALSHVSIVTFSTLYAFIRIPLAFLFDMNYNYAHEKTMVFYRSIIYGSEIYLAVLFFLILQTRFLSIIEKDPSHNKSELKAVDSVNFLVIILIFDGLMRYYINVMAIPIEINPLTIHILKKMSFLVQITFNLLLTTMLCPLVKQIYEKTNESNRIEKPFWRPSKSIKSDIDITRPTGMTISEIHSPDQMYNNTEIIEYEEHREDNLQSK